MVQDLLERNVRVRESDCGRLCQMDMGALSREMEQKNYQTSFLVATAGKLYQVKEDRPRRDRIQGDGVRDRDRRRLRRRGERNRSRNRWERRIGRKPRLWEF